MRKFWGNQARSHPACQSESICIYIPDSASACNIHLHFFILTSVEKRGELQLEILLATNRFYFREPDSHVTCTQVKKEERTATEQKGDSNYSRWLQVCMRTPTLPPRMISQSLPPSKGKVVARTPISRRRQHPIEYLEQVVISSPVP